MSENTETSVVEIFYYYNDKGQKLYTSNELFAMARAQQFGNDRRSSLKEKIIHQEVDDETLGLILR